MGFNKSNAIRSLATAVMVITMISPSTIKFMPKHVSLESKLLSKYFSRDAKGKLSFVVPAPMLKLMNAKATTTSCDSSSSSSSTSTSTTSSDSDSSSDDSDSTAALDACDEKWSDYQSMALAFYHNALCRVNNGYTASAEKALCEFANVLDVDTSFSSLPVDVSDTFDLGVASYTLELAAQVPTETWATTLGYTVKATLTVNNSTYLVIYWDGSSTMSKGFLIENSSGFMDQQGSYVQWDLTDSDDQQVNVLAATMASGDFMAPLQSGYNGSGRSSDTALYGTVNYNGSTAETILQYVEIRAQRSIYGNAIGCFKVYSDGIQGGTLEIARSSNMQAGGSTSDSSTDATGMVGISIADSTTTTDAEATALTSDQLASLVDFTKSCDDVRQENLTSHPFHGNTVNFSAAPSDLF